MIINKDAPPSLAHERRGTSPACQPGTSWQAAAVSTLLCAAAAAVGWAAQRWVELPAVEMSLALVAYAGGGWEAARRSAYALRRGRLDVDLLMSTCSC